MLCAAVAGVGVFDMCKKFLPIVAVVCLGCAGIYYFMGTTLGTGAMTEAGAAQVGDLLAALADSYQIGPVTLIPLVVMIVCIVVQVPAIPSFLLGVVLAMVEAALLQGADCPPWWPRPTPAW